MRAALESQARQAVESAAEQATEQIRRSTEELAEKRAAAAEDAFRRWMGEFEQVRSGSREQFSADLAARQEEFLAVLKAEFEENFSRARRILEDLDQKAAVIRMEGESAAETASRMAQARLQIEAAEAARTQQPAAPTRQETAAVEDAAARWSERLESEMAVAQAQWNELLQSSLDSGIERLAAQLSERSQDVLRSAEQRMSERFAALQQPFAHVSSEAGENLATVKLALDAELSRARSSLGEIENAASRMKEYSAQLEAASHDALNELHRRLEKILETQTEEMSRRFELLAAGVPQRVAPSLDSLGQQFVERTVAEVESKLAPRLERVPPLLRELASREVQAEEGLRLHRERLRQIAENNQREAAAQLAATLANLRGDFEAARKEALAKWNEELDASGVRAAHAATESIGRTSEWFQQEARARLQVLVEQGLASAGSGLEEQAAESAQKFTSQLDAQSTEHLAQIHQKLDAAAGEVEGRTRTQLEKAAEEAAASFGQVLRSISDQETVGFTNTSRAALRERVHELEHSAGSVLQNFESSAATSLDRLQSQMTEQVEAGVAEGRRALAAESASSLSAYANECAAREKELMLGLEFLTRDVAGKFEERLETTGDSWVISSVRRLNEHGQNAIESLMRSADQSLRDSCSRFFEGLAQTLRERGVFNSNAAGASAFQPIPESPHSRTIRLRAALLPERIVQKFSAREAGKGGFFHPHHFANRTHDVRNLLGAEIWMHRQAQDAFAGAFGVRKRSRRVAERGVGRLQVQGARVMNGRADFARGELRADPGAIADVDNELVIDAFVARIVNGEFEARVAEGALVFAGDLAAAGGPGVEAAELDAEDGALESVHAVVIADEFVLVTRRLSMRAGRASELRDLVVVGGKSAGFSIRAEILCGIEAKSRGVAEASDATSAIARPMRLGRIFEDSQAVTHGDFIYGVHVRGAAVEMNGQDGAGARRDGAREKLGVEVRRGGINIHEHGLRTAISNRLGGGEEGVRRGDDFVALLNTER